VSGSEAAVKTALKRYLKSIGAFQFWPVQMGYGSTTVDVLICHEGRFYGIETKRPGIGEPTARQAVVMMAIKAAGGRSWVESSTRLEATRAMFDIAEPHSPLKAPREASE
jgi:hypothetical protein